MSSTGGRPRLLVVDDHEDLHQLAGWIFRDEGQVCWTGLAPRGFAHGIAFEPGQSGQASQIRGLLGLRA